MQVKFATSIMLVIDVVGCDCQALMSRSTWSHVDKEGAVVVVPGGM